MRAKDDPQSAMDPAERQALWEELKVLSERLDAPFGSEGLPFLLSGGGRSANSMASPFFSAVLFPPGFTRTLAALWSLLLLELFVRVQFSIVGRNTFLASEVAGAAGGVTHAPTADDPNLAARRSFLLHSEFFVSHGLDSLVGRLQVGLNADGVGIPSRGASVSP